MPELAFDIKPYVEGWRKRNAEAAMAQRKKIALEQARRIAHARREK